ncbi:hypothetical protein UFOVP221_122 [uncultured Caudovirales phage]|uniref:Uncharacterized protein n=1 Tax=uncultured Caudovirales phage TaxID=2100421 RepID=A0A6J7WPL9_9CAUD|nr:hypothetical protein UFOVP221_122 [uncultured Caudovirales phage]
MANVVPEEQARFADPDSLEAQVREYALVKATLESMEARQKVLREALFAKLDEEGYEDDKGNVILELDSVIEGVVRIEKNRRVQRKLDEAVADGIIAERGIGDDVYEMKRVINEDSLMACLYSDKVTEEEIDMMFPPKVIWALVTKKK